MTEPVQISFSSLAGLQLQDCTGALAVFLDENGKTDPFARRIDRLTRGAVQRLAASTAFADLKPGEARTLAFPAGLTAEALHVVKLPRRPDLATSRKAGATLAQLRGKADMTVCAGALKSAAEIAFGLALMAYEFDTHKSKKSESRGKVTFAVTDPEPVARASAALAALTEGVFFTRDLVNEPANILTTDDFAARLAAMQELGIDVEILEESDLARIGMRALLGVGQGSPSPSKVVIMRWQNGGAEAPLALVGKGVVFDTGGVSIKPAAGMDEMTMDMGGAAVVAGVMRTLALRKARTHVVGLVGIVENSVDGLAQRPGDVVRSLKGDTIEVLNTDAEGRLVLADVLWYAQERFKPSAIIDLATLTGAIIVGLGHEMAGVFSNNDPFCNRFLAAAAAESEGAWRMPLSPAYDRLLKSRVADMGNIGGRSAGSITAAQFLQRFVKEGSPWIHLDIAGVTLGNETTALAPKGATAWGVRSINRLIEGHYQD